MLTIMMVGIFPQQTTDSLLVKILTLHSLNNGNLHRYEQGVPVNTDIEFNVYDLGEGCKY